MNFNEHLVFLFHQHQLWININMNKNIQKYILIKIVVDSKRWICSDGECLGFLLCLVCNNVNRKIESYYYYFSSFIVQTFTVTPTAYYLATNAFILTLSVSCSTNTRRAALEWQPAPPRPSSSVVSRLTVLFSVSPTHHRFVIES